MRADFNSRVNPEEQDISAAGRTDSGNTSEGGVERAEPSTQGVERESILDDWQRFESALETDREDF